MYRHPRTPAPEPELLAKIKARKDDAVLYLRTIRNFVNETAREIEEERKTLAKLANDPDVTMEKVRTASDNLVYLLGTWEGAKHFYGTALGALNYRDDLDLDMIHLLVWREFMERWAHFAADDSWSGYRNDDRRRRRDGFYKALDRIKWLPHTPTARFEKPEASA